ncbi:MAG: mechanosensitive ion channel, partial [Planctomycetales bacterium]|nr:mechanosensitive ion channel [Planctomycetales bacterium]
MPRKVVMMKRTYSSRIDLIPIAGLVLGVLLGLVPTSAWGQIPGRSFRSTIPSRVIPAENVVPVEAPSQEPTPAREPEPTPAERPAPRVFETVPFAGQPIPAAAEQLPEPGVPKVAWRPTRKVTTDTPRAGTSADPTKTTKLVDGTGAKNDVATGSGESEEPEGVTTLVKDEFQQVLQKVLYVWRFPFLKTKDFDLSLQVIIGGLFLLWLGNKLARRLSTWLGDTVLRRVGLPPATAAPLQKMSFYMLFGLFAVFSLQLVGVPMTVFTFFGGALAIGIGFGSQNVMNNFISGLILLIERPIRVGDVIQIDSHSGKVSEIGARSTRITTGSNLEVIIPNSTFLQGNVVNWTLSDDRISS